MKTTTLKPADPQWIIIDAEGQNLGRMSTQIASALRGKNKPTFSPHQLCGDHVIVINAEKLFFHPTKHRRKVYVTHSGYLGHLKTKSLQEMMDKKPTQIIEKAVKGMLPKNRLSRQMLKRLHVYTGTEHKHEAQQPKALTSAK
ncbi:MAG: 50S ribosomal protein L13 [Candidatus Peribacter sp.]|jgi:large subunit ribosomal protein L13|nr:50S ribosomal protein L13 [Candidatus Peribacter sp.]MBT4392567.1 50S ribosomal protein L13 [Candidatus Peribacter sp.]MBT4601422.1 50S ribosomal protein L13 [Candidatus Peribacter sp.]MBT5149113.1 50S ribosomal protein L13 [Candidatus Peribacter sp.]MBT5638112.1 50S ribosomal protein L13 [Candidatus Peribacter sp.]